MVVGARQIFQFLRQLTWFLVNNKVISKFRYEILNLGMNKMGVRVQNFSEQLIYRTPAEAIVR